MTAAIILFVVFDTIVVLGIVFYVMNKRKKSQGANSPYHRLSEAFGVPLQGGDPLFPNVQFLRFLTKPIRVEGTYRERLLKIYDFSSGGENSSNFHALELSKKPANLTFKLAPEGFFSKIGKTIGMQDIQTGDRVFDDAFIVKSNDENFIHSAFLPEIREQFLNIHQRHQFSSLELKNSQLRYVHGGFLNDETDLQRAKMLVPAMADLAAAIEVYSGH